MLIKRIVLSIVAVLAVVGIIAAVPLGDRSGDVAPSGQSRTDDSGISSAELEDLRAVAVQLGITLEEATERYAWNDDFALAASQISEAFPESFAGAAIVGDDSAWVAFAGQVPDGASEMIDGFGGTHSDISVEKRVDLGFTEVELKTAIEAIHYAVFKTAEALDSSTSFDYAAGKITTNVVLEDTASDSVIDDLQAIAADKLTESTRASIVNSITTSVVRSDDPVLGGKDDDSKHLGGEIIDPVCSSGFVTVSSSGVRGISTAGHCSDSQTDDGVGLTFEGDLVGPHGDFQWHSGPLGVPNEFYAGSSSSTETDQRSVLYVQGPSVGQLLCQNGRTTYKHCERVRKLNVCNGDPCNLVEMEARHAAGGDSGGPVYWGNTAYGLHQGWKYDPIYPFDRDLFSRADRIDNALGISIAYE